MHEQAKSNSDTFYTIEALKVALDHVEQQSKLLSNLANMIRVDIADEPITTANFLLYGSLSSADSMRLLGMHKEHAGCFVMARVVFEILLNAAFILASGKEVAERANRHSVQKSWRDLKRESVMAGHSIRLGFIGRSIPEEHPDLQQALEDYSGPGGSERRKWTPESIDERLEVVAQRYGVKAIAPLHWAKMIIYRHSSEIIHGTLFSVHYLHGLTTPSSETDLERMKLGTITMLLHTVGFMITTIITLVGREIDIKAIVDESRAISLDIAHEPWATVDD